MKGSVCLCRRTLLPNTDADAALPSRCPTRIVERMFERGLLIAAVLIVVIAGRADAQPAIHPRSSLPRVVHYGRVDCRRPDSRRGKHHRVRVEGRPAPALSGHNVRQA